MAICSLTAVRNRLSTYADRLKSAAIPRKSPGVMWLLQSVDGAIDLYVKFLRPVRQVAYIEAQVRIVYCLQATREISALALGNY